MRAMIIVPDSTRMPSFTADVKVHMVREGHIKLIEFLPPQGTVLVLVRPELVTDINALVRRADEETAINKACAFLPANAQKKHCLATAAAAYAFNAKDLHLAGGMDPRLSIEEMSMDAMFRLASRALTVTALPTELVSDTPTFSISSYLTVFTRNLTTSTQLRYLAPLFLGIIDQPMRDAGVDTSTLDLQRSPGKDDVFQLAVPNSAFSGAQAMRRWIDDFSVTSAAKEIISQHRRIPDTHLAHLDAFVDEIWNAAGVPSDTQRLLRSAFDDISTPPSTTLLYAVRTDNTEACSRIDEIHRAVNTPAFRYDPYVGTLQHSHGADDSWTDASDQFAEARDCSVVYLIDVYTYEVPWIEKSPSVVIFDATTTDFATWLSDDFAPPAHEHKNAYSRADVLSKTLHRVDRVIVKDDVQCDFLLGAIFTTLRLSIHTYDEDHSLANLIAIENGTELAYASIEYPYKPFECVDNSMEYEHTIFNVPPQGGRTFNARLRRFIKRVLRRLKGVFS